jgi:signal transduction histidine kinase
VASLARRLTRSAAPARDLIAEAAAGQLDFEGGLALLSDGQLTATSRAEPIWQSAQVGPWIAEGGEPIRFLTLTGSEGEAVTLVAASQGEWTVVGAFDPAALARRSLSDVFTGTAETSAVVVTAEGWLLYSHGASRQLAAELITHPGVTAALRGESGTTYVRAGEAEHVVAFSPVLPVNWALVIEEPWAALDDPLLRTTRAGLLLLTPVLLITLLALGFGVNQIVRPLQMLRDRATALAWGNFEAIEEPVGGIDEIGRLQQELIHMANKVRMAQQGLRSYLGAVTAGQEEERRRLARELHDDTIQALIALNQRVQLAQLAANQPATGLLEEMQAMTTQLIADLRRFTHALRPTYLEDLGLTPALEMLAKDTSEAIAIPVTFELVGPAGRLAPEVELAFYRMTQEALSNVARHAAASQAAVRLAFAPEQVSLEISDDGRGFAVPESPAEMVPAGHFGLLGLQERAELIGARLEISSRPGTGTRLTVTLPRHG